MAPRTRIAAAGLVLAMGLGSLLMWVANPVFWLWLASRLVDSREPSMGPYLLVITGIALTMAGAGKLLGALNRLHIRVTRGTPPGRVQAAWLRSMRGERVPSRSSGVLDVVMVTSVGIAVLVMAVWFFLFAGSSLGPA
jgi:hypothetical protein